MSGFGLVQKTAYLFTIGKNITMRNSIIFIFLFLFLSCGTNNQSRSKDENIIRLEYDFYLLFDWNNFRN